MNQLLVTRNLFVVDEETYRVEHCLLGLRGAVLDIYNAEQGRWPEWIRVLEMQLHFQEDPWQRVEPLAEGALKPGDRVVVGGAHYVMDGEKVSLAEELEAQQ